MTIYGRTAIDAAELVCKGVDPLVAWNECIVRYTNCRSSQEKSCPKTAFLTLAKIYIDNLRDEENLSANGKVTFKTLRILSENPKLVDNKIQLWNKLDTGTKHNSQLDVIVSILNSKLFSLN